MKAVWLLACFVVLFPASYKGHKDVCIWPTVTDAVTRFKIEKLLKILLLLLLVSQMSAGPCERMSNQAEVKTSGELSCSHSFQRADASSQL